MDKETLKKEILSLGSDNLHVFGGLYEGGIHLQQQIDEAIGYISFLIERKSEGEKIEKFLEVGSASGGNTFVLDKYLNLETIMIVDDNQHPKHHLRNKILENVNINKTFIGDSQSKEIIEKVRNTGVIFDFMFIDGDHSYNGVKNDTINYTPFLRKNGYVLFHDFLSVADVRDWILEFEKNEFFKKVADFKFKHGVVIFQKITD